MFCSRITLILHALLVKLLHCDRDDGTKDDSNYYILAVLSCNNDAGTYSQTVADLYSYTSGNVLLKKLKSSHVLRQSF